MLNSLIICYQIKNIILYFKLCYLISGNESTFISIHNVIIPIIGRLLKIEKEIRE